MLFVKKFLMWQGHTTANENGLNSGTDDGPFSEQPLYKLNCLVHKSTEPRRLHRYPG